MGWHVAISTHKIARTVYHLLKDKTPYHDLGAEKYEQQFWEREVTHLRKQAVKLGFTLTSADA
jgi:transposase